MIAAPAIPFIAAGDDGQTGLWLAALRLAMPDQTIVPLAGLDHAARAACRVAIVANPDPALLETLPNLRWVHSVWAGVEKLLAALAARGHNELKVVRLVDPQLADTMAEAVLAWALYLHRDMPAYARQQRAGQWEQREYRRAGRKTVSLLGLGALGAPATQHLLAAGFQVCGWSRTEKQLPNVQCFAGLDGLRLMLARTDILVCLLPLTAATHHLIDAVTLAALPGGAALINFARGPVIDDNALRAALDSGQLEHAVLDVFVTEPLPPAQWQWSHPRVTVLPHCSAPTDRESASAIVAGNLRRYFELGVMPDSVDPARGY